MKTRKWPSRHKIGVILKKTTIANYKEFSNPPRKFPLSLHKPNSYFIGTFF